MFKDYTKYSNNEPEDIELDVDVTPDDLQEPEPPKMLLIGAVDNCEKLNIREEPIKTAEVVAILKKNTEVMIDVDDSNDEWYSVCTAVGIEGYCMKDYITVQE